MSEPKEKGSQPSPRVEPSSSEAEASPLLSRIVASETNCNSAPAYEDLAAAILAYPDDEGVAKALALSGCASEQELRGKPERWPDVIAALTHLTAQQPIDGDQAYAAILKTVQSLALTADDPKGIEDAKHGIFKQIFGAWDNLEKPLRKLVLKELWRKIPGKDKPSPTDLMVQLEVRRSRLRGKAVRVRLQGMMLTEKGQPCSNTRNAFMAIRQLLPNALHFNEFNQEDVICWPGEPERNWKETDTTRLQVRLQELGLAALQPGSVEAAVKLIASEHTINPIVESLHGLHWDHTRRLSIWLREVFGTPTDRYHIRAGRNLFIALVARAMQPGCQVDEVVVFEGEQGTLLKSSAWRIIGGPYFRELTADPHSKDFEQQLLGVWLGEFAEMHTLRRADASRIKQFVTNLIDHFRLPYGRKCVDLPRRIVFCGATNETTDWLTDHTGGRRWIPIKVLKPANLEWLRANRDQLFAEAVHLFKAGRKWHVYPLEEARAQQEMRTAEDPWAQPIAAYLCGRQEVTVSEIISHVLDVPVREQTRVLSTRVGMMLSRLKCTPTPVRRINGEPQRAWTVSESFASQKIKISPWGTEQEFNRDPDSKLEEKRKAQKAEEQTRRKAQKAEEQTRRKEAAAKSTAKASETVDASNGHAAEESVDASNGHAIDEYDWLKDEVTPESAKSNDPGQDNVQTLMKQLRTTQEHAEKLVNAGLATPELVTQAPIKTLTDISGHQVYAKTLQNEARKWLSAQRAGGNAR
jgi:predicted P-loop ATPase